MAKLTKKQKALEGKVDALKLHGVDEAIKILDEVVAKAPADGYTIMVHSGTHVSNASLYSKLPYDTLKDFTPVAMAVMVTGFVSFGLWMHHMYTTGLPELGLSFFAAASLMIGVASGIQVFAWIATLWGTRPRFTTAFLYVLGFFFVFVLGGFTGVVAAWRMRSRAAAAVTAAEPFGW